jgi:hypothetical protein
VVSLIQNYQMQMSFVPVSGKMRGTFKMNCISSLANVGTAPKPLGAIQIQGLANA